MKLTNSTILAIVIAGSFSLTAYVMGQGHGRGPSASGVNHMSSTGMQKSQFGRNRAASAPTRNVRTSPTPPGHHYGWQKGKHNPHHSPTP